MNDHRLSFRPASFLTAIAITLLVLSAPHAFATGCTLEQLTDDTGATVSAFISADGNRIVFRSIADFLGGNEDGNLEMFLYDVATRTVIAQITDTTGITAGGTNPSISGDGTRVAFFGRIDPVGENADGGFELFVYDATTDSISQIGSVPTSQVGSSLSISFSRDGSHIAFSAGGDYTGGNPEGNTEVFLYDFGTDSISQITDTSLARNEEVTLDADGTRIAFTSSAEFVAGSNTDGSRDLFLYDTGTASFAQLTETVGTLVRNPSISGDGGLVAFESYADLTGGNPDGSYEIFVWDETAGGLAQISDSVYPTGCFNAQVASDGTRVAFESTADLTGGNPTNSGNIFYYDFALETLTQVTSSILPATTNGHSISGDGTLISVAMNDSTTSTTADGDTELFLSSCPVLSAAPCPKPQGFWRANPGSWPVSSLALGAQTYSQAELLAVLDLSPKGDASLILAKQLIAAKLSLANGSDPAPIAATVTTADAQLSAYAGKLPYGLKKSSAARQAMLTTATTLEGYNGGAMTVGCVP